MIFIQVSLIDFFIMEAAGEEFFESSVQAGIIDQKKFSAFFQFPYESRVLLDFETKNICFLSLSDKVRGNDI